jgi:hypothetical protein
MRSSVKPILLFLITISTISLTIQKVIKFNSQKYLLINSILYHQNNHRQYKYSHNVLTKREKIQTLKI